MNRPVGSMIGRYELGEKLRDSTTGAVFRAVEPTTGRHVMLVSLSMHGTGRRGALEPPRVLIARTATLRHPRIAAVIDIVRDGELVFAVEPLVEGRTLADLIASDAPLAPERVVEIVAQVADALDEIHARGLLHGDLHPASVVLDRHGTATLVDVGLVALVATSRERSSGIVLGRPEYTAPEAVTGDGQRVSADLYALGVLTYALLVGRPPFVGQSPTAVISAQVSAPPPSPRTFRPDLSEAVERVVLRQLAKAPARRYLSAGGFAADLAHAVLDDPSEAPTARSVHRLGRPRGTTNGTGQVPSTASPAEELRARATASLEAGDWRAALADVEALKALDPEGAARIGRLAAAVREAEAAREAARRRAAEEEQRKRERAARADQLVLHAQAALDAGNLEYAEQLATRLTVEFPDLGVATAILHEARRRRQQRQAIRARASERLEAGDWRGALSEIDRLHALGDMNVGELERMGEALWRADVARSAAERRVAELDATRPATEADTDPSAPIPHLATSPSHPGDSPTTEAAPPAAPVVPASPTSPEPPVQGSPPGLWDTEPMVVDARWATPGPRETPPTPHRRDAGSEAWAQGSALSPGSVARPNSHRASQVRYARWDAGRPVWTWRLIVLAALLGLIALGVLLAARVATRPSRTAAVDATATVPPPPATSVPAAPAQPTAGAPTPPTREMPTPTLAPTDRLAAAEAALAGGDFARAIDLLEQLKRTDPSIPGVDDALYRAHLGYGRALHERGDLDASAANLARALELRPNDPAALEALRQVTLARHWARMEAAWSTDDDAAIAALEEIVRLDPNYRDARQKLYAKLIARAQTQLARGDRDGALVSLLRATELVPDGPEARALLAQLTPTPVPPTATVAPPTATPRGRPVAPRPAPSQPARPVPARPAPAAPGPRAPVPRPDAPIVPPSNQPPTQVDRPFRPPDRPL